MFGESRVPTRKVRLLPQPIALVGNKKAAQVERLKKCEVIIMEERRSMTKYEELMNQKDICEFEARRLSDKADEFKALAEQYEAQAKSLTIGEALR